MGRGEVGGRCPGWWRRTGEHRGATAGGVRLSAGVSVRDASVADAARLVALIAAGAVDGPAPVDPDLGPYRDALAEIAAQRLGTVLVAEVAGEVVGMCQVIVFRHVQRRGGLCAELESMHVDPTHRGQGIGGLLVEAAAARARAWGCYRLQLSSNVARTDAHRFYAAHGFVASHLGFKRPL